MLESGQSKSWHSLCCKQAVVSLTNLNQSFKGGCKMKRRIGFVAVAAIVTSLTLSVPVFAQSTCTQTKSKTQTRVQSGTQTQSKTQTQSGTLTQTQTKAGNQTQVKAGH
jgi:hypothetical protein